MFSASEVNVFVVSIICLKLGFEVFKYSRKPDKKERTLSTSIMGR